MTWRFDDQPVATPILACVMDQSDIDTGRDPNEFGEIDVFQWRGHEYEKQLWSCNANLLYAKFRIYAWQPIEPVTRRPE